MHEDAAIELGAFEPGGRIFCIASAGCTAMQLARHHEIVAVDLNPLQIAYVKRRLAGAGIKRGGAERFQVFARSLAPIAGWNRRKIQTFLDLEDPNEQLPYWQQHLDTHRFRLGLDFLLSRPVLHAIYSDAFLDCLPSNFGAVLRKRMERCFQLHSNRTNPYARALLLGEIPTTPRLEPSQTIQLVCEDAAGYLERQSPCSFTGFTLSNIFDGASPGYVERLFAAVQHAADPGAVVVLRSFSEPSEPSLPTNHAARDRSMLWGIVDVQKASNLCLRREPPDVSRLA